MIPRLFKLHIHVFAGGVFHCEDEPEEFEWNRLTELQRRNTLCPAHLKTSYPVETQHVKPQEFTDDALRYSMMPSGKKRKNEQLSDEDDTKSSMHLRSIKQVCTSVMVAQWLQHSLSELKFELYNIHLVS